MCGVVGIAGQQDREWIRQMNSSIAHRGPDDAGEYFNPESSVSMAMRRLSIIDLQGGHQPMPNKDRSVWIV